MSDKLFALAGYSREHDLRNREYTHDPNALSVYITSDADNVPTHITHNVTDTRVLNRADLCWRCEDRPGSVSFGGLCAQCVMARA